jgi:hypothetical protein
MDMRRVLDAEASAVLRVDKADGRVLYYRVSGDQTTQITQDEYDKEIG